MRRSEILQTLAARREDLLRFRRMPCWQRRQRMGCVVSESPPPRWEVVSAARAPIAGGPGSNQKQRRAQTPNLQDRNECSLHRRHPVEYLSETKCRHFRWISTVEPREERARTAYPGCRGLPLPSQHNAPCRFNERWHFIHPLIY